MFLPEPLAHRRGGTQTHSFVVFLCFFYIFFPNDIWIFVGFFFDCEGPCLDLKFPLRPKMLLIYFFVIFTFFSDKILIFIQNEKVSLGEPKN